jgi:Domain of unknown function (DUF4178)
MTAESRRMLGVSLLAGSAGIALLMLTWLMISGVQAGGAVLGLLLLFVLAGPLAAGGYYVLVQGRAEHAQEQQFAGKRRILDADRLFRRELAARLRQLAAAPGMPTQQLTSLAEVVENASQDESAWYDAIQLDDTETALLRQYDDLVWERVRWLGDHAGEPTTTLIDAITQLQTAIDQRMDLLVRGRQAPAVAPTALLRAQAAAPEAVATLGLGDAISHDGVDYLVEGVVSSFAEGQTWKLLHLVPSGADAVEHWLSVAPRSLELAWLDNLAEMKEPGRKEMAYADATLPLVGEQSATAQVETRAGSTPGVLVRSWTYRQGRMVATVEQWPDGAVRAYAGHVLDARQLEVWPAARNAHIAAAR